MDADAVPNATFSCSSPNRHRNLQVSSKAASVTKPKHAKRVPKEPVKGAIGPHTALASGHKSQSHSPSVTAVVQREKSAMFDASRYQENSRNTSKPNLQTFPDAARCDKVLPNNSRANVKTRQHTTLFIPETPSPAKNSNESKLNDNKLTFNSSVLPPALLSYPTSQKTKGRIVESRSLCIVFIKW